MSATSRIQDVNEQIAAYAKQRVELTTKIAEKGADHWTIDSLLDLAARESVLAQIATSVQHMRESQTDMDDEHILEHLVDFYTKQVVLSAWQSKSTSVASNEIDTRKHYYWLQVLQHLQGIGFVSI